MSLILGFCRVYYLAPSLLSTTLRMLGPLWLSFLMGIAINTNNYLCLAYTLERILATVFVKSYERQKPYIGIIFSLLIVSVPRPPAVL